MGSWCPQSSGGRQQACRTWQSTFVKLPSRLRPWHFLLPSNSGRLRVSPWQQFLLLPCCSWLPCFLSSEGESPNASWHDFSENSEAVYLECLMLHAGAGKAHFSGAACTDSASRTEE